MDTIKACLSVVLTWFLLLQLPQQLVSIFIGSGNECIEETCISFESLLQNTSAYFNANSQMKFSSGEYTVVAATQVVIHNINNISLLSVDDGQLIESGTVIDCNGNLSFIFINVTNIRLSGLTFIKCGLQVAPQYFQDSVLLHDTFALFALYAAFFFVDVDGLSITNVSIVHSRGYGVLGVNMRGNSSIEDSVLCGDSSQASLPLRSTSTWGTSAQDGAVNCFFGNSWFLSDSDDAFAGDLRFSFRSITISWTDTFYSCYNTRGGVFVQTGLGFEFQQSSYSAEIDIYNIRVIGASINTFVRDTASNIAFIIKNTIFFAGVASYTFNMNPRGKWTNYSHASQHVYKVIHCEFKSSISKPFGSMNISFISETLLGAVQTVNIVVYKCYFSERTRGLTISSPSMVTGSKFKGTIRISHCKIITKEFEMLSFANYNHLENNLVSVNLDFVNLLTLPYLLMALQQFLCLSLALNFMVRV